MARSKVTTPSGKKVTPKKKRDTKARASVKITQRKDGDFDVVKRNDNDPTVTYTERDKRKKVRGPDKVTKKHIPGKTTTKITRGKETAASIKADKAWQKAKPTGPSNPNGLTNYQRRSASTGLPKKGTEGRPVGKYHKIKTTKTTPSRTETTRTPTTKKNKDYNKKKPPTKSYSKAAKNPGGHILGIPKKEKLNKKDTAAYRAYLRNNSR